MVAGGPAGGWLLIFLSFSKAKHNALRLVHPSHSHIPLIPIPLAEHIFLRASISAFSLPILFQSSARAARHLWASSAATDRAIPKEWSTPRLEFGWTCALLSPEGGVCVRWCNVVPFQAAGQGISREDSAAQPGAERLQAAFRPRRNSQPSRADGVLLGSGPAPRFSCTWTVRVRRVRVLGGRGQYIWRVAIEG